MSENFFIIKAKQNNTTSKQKEEKFSQSGIKDPPNDPSNILAMYEKSFLVGGLVDKVATTASSDWIFDENVSEETRRLCESIDQQFLFKNLFLFGNVFFEKIKNLREKTIFLEPCITTEIRVKVEKDKETGKKIISYIQNPFGDSENFSSDEIVHLKTSSISSRYYGDSPITRAIRQIILLEYIDKYYENLFNRGQMKSRIFIDPEKSLDSDQLTALKTVLEEKMSGIDNAFTSIFIRGKIETIELDNNADTEAFLNYRDKLISSIAIALNIPVDIIVPEKASRNTKAESIVELNDNIILPLQEQAMRLLRNTLRDEYPDIDGVSFYPVDNKNKNLKTEMEIFTGYKKEGILTANEVREKIGHKRIAGGNELTNNSTDNTEEEIEKIQQEISKIYEK